MSSKSYEHCTGDPLPFSVKIIWSPVTGHGQKVSIAIGFACALIST